MNDVPWTLLITSVFTFLAGGGGKWILDLFKESRAEKLQSQKQKDDKEERETDKALSMYKDLIAQLKSDLEGITKGMTAMDKEHLELREKNAVLNGKLETANTRVEFLEKELTAARVELEQWKKKS